MAVESSVVLHEFLLVEVVLNFDVHSVTIYADRLSQIILKGLADVGDLVFEIQHPFWEHFDLDFCWHRFWAQLRPFLDHIEVLRSAWTLYVYNEGISFNVII